MVKVDKNVTISNHDKVYFTAHLIIKRVEDQFILDLHSEEINCSNLSGSDYLDCLFHMRQFLEQRQMLILCQGSAINVHTSGMARDMSDALMAYSLQLGKKSSSKQLVNIFDSAPIEAVGLIAQQEAFFHKWHDSLKI